MSSSKFTLMVDQKEFSNTMEKLKIHPNNRESSSLWILLFGILVVCSTLLTEGAYPIGSLPCKLHDATILDCTHRYLTSIPPLPPNITSIDLTKNGLQQIYDSDFALQTKLIDVVCSYNTITVIEGSPFRLMSRLETLFLNNNQMRNLSSEVFQGLISLRYLDLKFNLIALISEEAFKDLANLEELYLRENLLRAIPDQALSYLVSLQTLDFGVNPCTNFTLGNGFKSLVNLSYFNFHCILDDATESPIINNKTLVNLAAAPLSFFKFLWDSENDEIQVIVEDGVFSPLKSVSVLITMYDLFYEVPRSLDSELQHIEILLDVQSRIVNNVTLQNYSRWNASLTYLDFSLSLFGAIEDHSFKWFPELRILDLQGLYLPLMYITDEAFYGLNKLEELYLARNHLSVLPVNAFKSFSSGSLRVLDLSYNSLNGIFPSDSFSAISSITHLDVSHNPIFAINEWMNVLTNLHEFKADFISSEKDYLASGLWSTPLVNLRTFSMTNPNFKLILQYALFILSKKAPNLEYANFAGAYLTEVKTIANLTELKELDLTGSLVQWKKTLILAWQNEIHYPVLKKLMLGSNELTQSEVDNLELNKTVPLVSSLDLSNNLIEHISIHQVLSLINLQSLNLGSNKLLEIQPFLQWKSFTPSSLDLSLNSISNIPEDFVSILKEQRYETLNLGGNPFACTCAIETFRKWILSDSQVFLIPSQLYQCQRPKNLLGFSITDINLDCSSHLVMYIGIGIACGIAMILIIVLTVRYRFHIRYGLFLLYHRRRVYRPAEGQAGNNDDDINMNIMRPRYDAFVSYAHQSDRDLEWVLNELRPNLEEGDEPFRLCIGHARDFLPGESLLDAITESIHNSRKTIVVLTPSYLESEWCYFETQHAWLRLLNQGQDVLILILLEPIPDDKMTMWLRQFLLKKGYLPWPPDKAAQNLFFRCLRQLIKEPAGVNRRYDV